VIGGALGFDGRDDCVELAAEGVHTGFLHDPFEERSVFLRVRAATANGAQTLYDEGGSRNGLALRVNAGALEAVACNRGNSVRTSAPFTSTTWKDVAVVFDRGSFRLYVDGSEMASVKAGFAAVGTHGSASALGASGWGDAFGRSTTGAFFAGLIDDVRIYNRALSAEEIGALAVMGSR
jgi:hypothetical protein